LPTWPTDFKDMIEQKTKTKLVKGEALKIIIE
jgi:hypothetical protein